MTNFELDPDLQTAALLTINQFSHIQEHLETMAACGIPELVNTCILHFVPSVDMGMSACTALAALADAPITSAYEYMFSDREWSSGAASDVSLTVLTVRL